MKSFLNETCGVDDPEVVGLSGEENEKEVLYTKSRLLLSECGVQ